MSSQNGEGNQATYLASEVAFEAINEWESMSVRYCVSEPSPRQCSKRLG